jgi:hypothetical protein
MRRCDSSKQVASCIGDSAGESLQQLQTERNELMGKSWIEEFGISDNLADFRRRRFSRDSFEVQASQRGLFFQGCRRYP